MGNAYVDISGFSMASLRASDGDVVCVPGGFDPLHAGHIEWLRAAGKYGRVIVMLYDDPWLIEKKGYRIMDLEHRAAILRELRSVFRVTPVRDKDGTICRTLEFIRPRYLAVPRGSLSEAELQVCGKLDIEVLYDIVPRLRYSSSKLVAHRRPRETEGRKWGTYEVFEHQTYPEPPHWKVKRLDLAPGQKTSRQRHDHREEHWVITRGVAIVHVGSSTKVCVPGKYIHVPLGEWHQIINSNTNIPLTLVEVQMGRTCEEGDIEREGETKKQIAPMAIQPHDHGGVEGDV